MVRASWAQVDDTAALVGGDPEPDIEPGPALRLDFAGERRADLAFAARSQLQ